MITKDHDLLEKGVVKKVGTHEKRPHADGCVGCRREAMCIFCSKSRLFTDDQCLSGACTECCEKNHRHANNDKRQIVMVVE